jgi:hypothetical protein
MPSWRGAQLKAKGQLTFTLQIPKYISNNKKNISWENTLLGVYNIWQYGVCVIGITMRNLEKE